MVTGKATRGGVAVLVLGAIWGVGGCSSGSSTQGAIKSNCHSAVEAQLTSPAADYHDESIDRTNDGTGWSMVGSVDSGLLTWTFICRTDSSGNVADDPVLIQEN